MILAHPQLSVNDVSINGEDLEGVYVMLYFESWIKGSSKKVFKTQGRFSLIRP
jgi:hypothetical protein